MLLCTCFVLCYKACKAKANPKYVIIQYLSVHAVVWLVQLIIVYMFIQM